MAHATVRGVVSRINSNGIGFSVKESWPKRDGTEAHRYWSVFLPDNVPVEVIAGDEVTVTGQLRTAVSKRDARYVDHTISNARVEVTRQNGPRSWEPPVDDVPPDDPYADGPAWSVAPIPA